MQVGLQAHPNDILEYKAAQDDQPQPRHSDTMLIKTLSREKPGYLLSTVSIEAEEERHTFSFLCGWKHILVKKSMKTVCAQCISLVYDS